MVTSRFSTIDSFCAAMLPVAIILSLMASGAAAAPIRDLPQHCRQALNDDEIRGYAPELHNQTIEGFRKLFPGAAVTPDSSEFQTQAQYRCMNGKVMICFIGANLPCSKINVNRDNPGANEYCRGAKNGDSVPAAAAGHDTLYTYECYRGKPKIVGTIWQLDQRGFAKKLWTELPSR
jgi:hypothetical protein